ncbi:MAG: hypothetical protein K8W52_23880 [Deltaproteobacteria bacterium]|nr:hypothetical protein [Deltaproteobacteria bacterium]
MADLVIGGRRASPHRVARAVGFLIALLVVAFVVAWFIYRRSVSYDEPGGTAPDDKVVVARDQPGLTQLRYGQATLGFVGDLRVLRAAGDAHTLGAAQGRLLADRLAAAVASMAPGLDAAVGEGGLFSGTHGMRVAWRYRFIDDGLPEDQRRVVAGIARGAERGGAEIDFEDLLRDQAALDVAMPAPWSSETRTHVVARSLTVVAPQATAGRVWIGRSLSLPGAGEGGEALAASAVITFFKPTGKLAWAGVGWAGLAGAVTGINSEGLAVLVDPARAGDVRATRTARPMALLARAILEQCTTLDEAIKLADQTPTLGAAAFVVVDGKSGRWALLERTPSRLVVTRDPPLSAVGDLLTAPPFADDLENDRGRRMLPTVDRVARAARLTKAPLADVAAVAAVLRDRRGKDDAPLPDGHRAAIADASAIQTVIIDPAAMTLWVADGDASARFRAFDLRHELRGDGDRAAPPADIPEEAEPAGAQARAIRLARADLRRARQALLEDDLDRAIERCGRALARVPTLPEALQLEGELARARGDLAGARAALGQWLDNGPDDPGAAEEVKAQLGR